MKSRIFLLIWLLVGCFSIEGINAANTQTIPTNSSTPFYTNQGTMNNCRWYNGTGDGGPCIAYANKNSTVSYNINCTKAGKYKLKFRASTANANRQISFTITQNGRQIINRTVNISNNGWSGMRDYSIEIPSINGGECTMVATFLGESYVANLREIAFEYVGSGSSSSSSSSSSTAAVSGQAIPTTSSTPFQSSKGKMNGCRWDGGTGDGAPCIAFAQGNSTVTYDLNCTRAGRYKLKFRASTANDNRKIKFVITQNGKQIANNTVTIGKHGWSSMRDYVIEISNIANGACAMTVTFIGQTYVANLRDISFEYVGAGSSSASSSSSSSSTASLRGQAIPTTNSTPFQTSKGTMNGCRWDGGTGDGAPCIAFAQGNSTVTYDLNCTKAGRYKLKFRASTANANRQISFTIAQNGRQIINRTVSISNNG